MEGHVMTSVDVIIDHAIDAAFVLGWPSAFVDAYPDVLPIDPWAHDVVRPAIRRIIVEQDLATISQYGIHIDWEAAFAWFKSH